MANYSQPRFLDYNTARTIADDFGSPVYVYDMATLKANAADVLAFPNAFGLTARYAMKASPNAAILKIFNEAGLHIDASSGNEVRRAIAAGVPAANISLSTQELPADFAELYELGIEINACSLNQLERFGQACPGKSIGVRFNPGSGSGGNNRTNVGGPASSFGIWHEWIDQVQAIVAQYDLKVIRIHTHIGSGSDPAVWQKISGMSLELVRQFPDVVALNLGGGYKVARMEDEVGTDLQECGAPVAEKFREFAKETGREIRLEVEPGTYLLANTCSVLSTVQDIVSTGADGYEFLKLNTGMTEILRPSIYGAQHPIYILQGDAPAETRNYMIAGHCCESGDILTPAPGDPELLATRSLPVCTIGDLCVIDGAGAYCAAMSTKHYNSYPEAAEIMLDEAKVPHVIRKRQKLEDIWANEVALG
ncbi:MULTISPECIES: diaminopimelate decarboxylase [unclassified Lentimonas]|uniref:diaminopimelate decarboxylase n=1 Tax=unclassified Lentimonas TaxID=2630993 RepID=UPI0013246CD2|nr:MULTISPECIES: diaminopimelate decarboxylase [unclassified Lentimonas]CAA6676556.1 Diaminopimelate decarboxylase (EC [Lentimonas sp. CC4]CAA6684780.1 Diaminopimelate decarboxylase (EC [Lentimonas sp. CC6]CAA7075416.1 Diaminopimelate decarboxylase (EC [Lentimonas sp. CC4]CAA7168921.1 Diaminopimelate decarboxylase (EC [Lentimonas sp. CC21]CAA7182174.1 Diaminopimelate decarboxylase (EC [Lentimonas sp. CC8]